MRQLRLLFFFAQTSTQGLQDNLKANKDLFYLANCNISCTNLQYRKVSNISTATWVKHVNTFLGSNTLLLRYICKNHSQVIYLLKILVKKTVLHIFNITSYNPG